MAASKVARYPNLAVKFLILRLTRANQRIERNARNLWRKVRLAGDRRRDHGLWSCPGRGDAGAQSGARRARRFRAWDVGPFLPPRPRWHSLSRAWTTSSRARVDSCKRDVAANS